MAYAPAMFRRSPSTHGQLQSYRHCRGTPTLDFRLVDRCSPWMFTLGMSGTPGTELAGLANGSTCRVDVSIFGLGLRSVVPRPDVATPAIVNDRVTDSSRDNNVSAT